MALVCRSGVLASDVGVITPYRAQRALLKDQLGADGMDQAAAQVEADTVDRFQGRDKACVFVSFTRHNPSKSVSPHEESGGGEEEAKSVGIG